MPIDPRMFLGIGGPVSPQAMLPPGFRAPPPGQAPPIMQPQGGEGGMPGMGMGMLPKMPGGGGGNPFAGVDVASMSPDQQIAAFSTYGNKSGESPFAGMDVSSMNPDQQIGAFSSYGPQGGGGFMNWLKGLF